MTFGKAEGAMIAENLHRADLTKLKRDEQVAEWIRLVHGDEDKSSEQKLSQPVTVSKGGRGNESGVRAAARELGVNRMDAHRATKVAAIQPEAKKAAVAFGLDDNRSALLAVAKETTAEAQVAKVAEIAAAKSAPPVRNIGRCELRAARQVVAEIPLGEFMDLARLAHASGHFHIR